MGATIAANTDKKATWGGGGESLLELVTVK